jgi:hypothetical protein
MIPTTVPKSMADLPGRRKVDPEFAHDERPIITHDDRVVQMREYANTVPKELKRARDRKSYLKNRLEILARKKARYAKKKEMK